MSNQFYAAVLCGLLLYESTVYAADSRPKKKWSQINSANGLEDEGTESHHYEGTKSNRPEVRSKQAFKLFAESPFVKNPSALPNLLDQIDGVSNARVVNRFMDRGFVGAKMVRATRPSFGISYGLGNEEANEKAKNNSTKTKDDGSSMNYFVVYPSPMGVRFGGSIRQTEHKAKISGDRLDNPIKAKLTAESYALSAAAVLPSGIGAALTLSTNSENISADYAGFKDLDAQFGHSLHRNRLFPWVPL